MFEFYFVIKGVEAYFHGHSKTISGIYANERGEIVFQLISPCTYFMELLCLPSSVISPSHALMYKDQDFYVGCGPFKLISFIPSETVILDYNDRYHEPNIPRLSRIHIDLRNSTKEILPQKLLKKELDCVYLADFSDIQLYNSSLKETEPFEAERVFSDPNLLVMLVFPNLSSTIFSDIRLRQAIHYSINRQALLQESDIHGFAQASSFFLPDYWLPLKPSFHYAQNIEKASQLIKDAGLVGQKIRLITPGQLKKNTHKSNQYILQCLIDIGLDPEVQFESADDIYRNKRKTNDIILAGWISDYHDPHALCQALFPESPEQAVLKTYVNDPELSALIAEGMITFNPRKRHRLYRDITQIVHKKAYHVPLYFRSSVLIKSPHVMSMDIMGSIPQLILKKHGFFNTIIIKLNLSA